MDQGLRNYLIGTGGSAPIWTFVLALLPAAIALGLQQGWPVEGVLMIGLILFGLPELARRETGHASSV